MARRVRKPGGMFIGVSEAKLSVASSINASFKFYYWELELDCGHTTERRCKYKKREGKALKGFAAMHAGRSRDSVLPAPTLVKCEECLAIIEGRDDE